MAVNAESFVPNWELTQLLDIFPLPIRQALVRLPNLDNVIEVVLDLGRPPEARFDDDFVFLGDTSVTSEDIAHVTARCPRIVAYTAGHNANLPSRDFERALAKKEGQRVRRMVARYLQDSFIHRDQRNARGSIGLIFDHQRFAWAH